MYSNVSMHYILGKLFKGLTQDAMEQLARDTRKREFADWEGLIEQ